MANETDIPSDDPFITAGEYALGVLEGEDLVAARRALLADRSFIDAVAWWDMRFAAMAEAGGALRPSDGVWRAIEARLTGRPQNVQPPSVTWRLPRACVR